VKGVKKKEENIIGYGIDEPRTIIQLSIAGVMAVALGIVTSFYTSSTNPNLARAFLITGPTVGFLILSVVSALYWSSKQGKIIEMSKVVKELPWGGDEIVLDVGCSRGLASILTAKQLKKGFVVGLDLWKKSDVTGNSPLSLIANSKKEGVDSKIVIVKADPRHIPFKDETFDYIVSSLYIHKVGAHHEREKVLFEIERVLKKGGRVAILDSGHGTEYSSYFERNGLVDVVVKRLRFRSFPPFHVTFARKPFT
jgi:arsenite methyltransferase